MRMADFGAICLENMKKQKGKVALAALGVLVGCFLLVILISFPLNGYYGFHPIWQLVLFCAAAVSLYGSALGIQGMLMNLTEERKRRIGLMKALGCLDRDIRILLMTEAGFISLLGGVGCCLASQIFSAAVNIMALGESGEERILNFIFYWDESDFAFKIPFWLILMELLLSLLIGLSSGYRPAIRAEQVTVLESLG